MRKLWIGRALVALTLLGACAWVASAQENTLYSFRADGTGDGSVPECTLIFDAAGNIYGTTTSGGTVGEPHDIYGTAFIMTPGPNNTWSEHVMYSFGGYSGDGIGPSGGLVFDKSGNLTAQPLLAARTAPVPCTSWRSTRVC
jgi:hypothetical protein